MRTTLGQAPCIAFVAPVAFWQELQATAPLPLASPDVAYRARAFTNEPDARQWLQSVQLAALGHGKAAYHGWSVGR